MTEKKMIVDSDRVEVHLVWMYARALRRKEPKEVNPICLMSHAFSLKMEFSAYLT